MYFLSSHSFFFQCLNICICNKQSCNYETLNKEIAWWVYDSDPHDRQVALVSGCIHSSQINRAKEKSQNNVIKQREIELEIYIQIYTHVCIFATCQLKGLCFLPQKKQRTKELSRIFHSYNPYDHKVRAACYQCDWVIEVFLNVEHRVRQYTVIWKYTSTNYIYISVLIFNSLSLIKKRENLYF